MKTHQNNSSTTLATTSFSVILNNIPKNSTDPLSKTTLNDHLSKSLEKCTSKTNPTYNPPALSKKEKQLDTPNQSTSMDSLKTTQIS